jgi:hypothetical protein
MAATNTLFAGEIVSQPRRKTPLTVAKIRPAPTLPKNFSLPRNKHGCRGVDPKGRHEPLVSKPALEGRPK